MRCFWDERQRGHAPAAEFFNGRLHPAAEHLGRVDAILSAIGPTEAPGDHGLEALLRVHSPAYLDLLRDAHGEWLAAGRSRIAILDVDYHHGNGTQDIVAGRDGVFFASIHADPSTDYPFFWGHADESEGNILNLPQPRGTDWSGYEPALTQAIDWLEKGAPDLLIVSYGADTHEADPISFFELKTSDYAPMARRITSMGLPTLIVMEGGYAVEALGTNVAEFLSGF